MPLYHFSEEPDIRVFEPRTGRLPDEAYVWAIDEWHAPMYYFPRDCPRACFWPGPQTTAEDRERWFGGIDAKMVIAVESAWLERIRSTKLYRYTLPDDGFELHDADCRPLGEPRGRRATHGRAARRPPRRARRRERRAAHHAVADRPLVSRHRLHARVLRHPPSQRPGLAGERLNSDVVRPLTEAPYCLYRMHLQMIATATHSPQTRKTRNEMP